jgi:hypothetical protein
MLLHPHVLVKLATAQLIGTVFSLLGDPNEVLSSLGWKRPKTVTTSAPEKRAENKSERYACCLEFIKGPKDGGWKRRLVDLCFACFSQLQSQLLNDVLSEQVSYSRSRKLRLWVWHYLKRQSLTFLSSAYFVTILNQNSFLR